MTQMLAQKAGCAICFLPAYSPDLNPIEKFWAHLKARVKKLIGQFCSLADAVDAAFKNDQLIFN